MKNTVVNAIGFGNAKKNRLVLELMGAGATATIIGGLCMVGACILSCNNQAWYNGVTNQSVEVINEAWTAIESSVTK